MWDLQSGKLLRTIPDAHPLGSAVLHVMVSFVCMIIVLSTNKFE